MPKRPRPGDEPATRPLAPSPAAAAPKQLGEYEILTELGRGGMGVVYLAKQPKLRRLVALKVLNAAGGASSSQIKRFSREARAMASLSHPRIVGVHDVGEADGLHYIAMEYIKGRPLSDRLAQRPRTPLRHLVSMLSEAAEALAEAHARGIVHRDIKPANILIDTEGHPHLVDFGLARTLDSQSRSRLTISGDMIGTPAYMPPEQIEGRVKDMAPPSDVYALGVILYEAAAGRLPFAGASSAAQLFYKVKTAEPSAPRHENPNVHRDLETIILKAMEKEPQRRYPDAAALHADLQRYLAGEPIEASPPGRVDQLLRRMRRNKLASALGAILAVGLLGVLGWLYLRPGQLALDTDPSGAEVLLDGESIGTTPLAETALGAGTYQLTFRKTGYLAQAAGLSELVVRRGQRRDLRVPLIPASGLLHVSATPPGASVKVVDAGGKTVHSGFAPVIAELPEGTYRVDVSHARHLPASLQGVQVGRARKVTRREIALVANTGRLQLTSVPADVTVTIRRARDGTPEERLVGRYSAPFAAPLALEAGSYELECTKQDHDTRRLRVVIARDRTLARQVHLPPLLRWHYVHPNTIGTIPSVGDAQGDGHLRVFLMGRGRAASLDLRGGIRWSYERTTTMGGGLQRTQRDDGKSILGTTHPLVVDLDRDGHDEMLIALSTLVCLGTRSGNVLWEAPLRSVATPAAGDTTGDRQRELVVVTQRGMHVRRGTDGTALWSMTLTETPGAPALVDMDGDGVLDVVFNAGSVVYCVSPKQRRTIWQTDLGESMFQTGMAAGDIDGDGTADVVAVSKSGTLVVLGRGGRRLWECALGEGGQCPPAICDLDGDGTAEIIVNSSHTTFAVGADGQVRWRRPRTEARALDPSVENLAVIDSMDGITAADLDGDGADEVLTGTRAGLACLNGRDGTVRWTFAEPGRITGAPVVADMDGDGRPELLVVSDKSLFCLSPPGNPLRWDATPDRPSPLLATADWDGDGTTELIAGQYDVLVFAADGRRLALVPHTKALILSLAVVDLDGDGPVELVLGRSDGTITVYGGRPAKARWVHHGQSMLRVASRAVDLDGDGVKDLAAAFQDGTLMTLSGKDGKPLARFKAPGSLHGRAPALVKSGGRWRVVAGCIDKQIYAIDALNGEPSWQRQLATLRQPFGVPYTPPLALDTDGDGDEEVLIGTQDKQLVCLVGDSGKVRWRQAVGYELTEALAAGDIEGDGIPEIALVGRSAATWHVEEMWKGRWVNVHVPTEFWPTIHAGYGSKLVESYTVEPHGVELRSAVSGALRWARPLLGSVRHPASIGDLDGDGKGDVAVGRAAFRGADGAVLAYLKPDLHHTGRSLYADLDGDGHGELVVAGDRLEVFGGLPTGPAPSIPATLAARPARAAWTSFRGGPRGTRDTRGGPARARQRSVLRHLLGDVGRLDARALAKNVSATRAAYPRWALPNLLLGRLLLRLGRHADAEAAFERVLAIAPHGEALASRGYCRLLRRQRAAAVKDLGQAVKQFPYCDAARTYLGILLARGKQPEAAIKELLAAARLDPVDLLPLMELAKLYEARDEADNRWAVLEAAYDIDEGDHIHLWPKANTLWRARIVELDKKKRDAGR